VLFFVADRKAKPTFDYEVIGERVRFDARPGEGLISATSQLRWDIDGDGTPDVDPKTGKVYDAPAIEVLLGDTGAKVNLFIDDPVTRKTRVVTRVLRLPDAEAAKAQEAK